MRQREPEKDVLSDGRCAGVFLRASALRVS